MKHKVKVVMLPTKGKTSINLYEGKLSTKPVKTFSDIPFGTMLLPGTLLELSTPQHLYITVSQDVEPIKEGDCWYYDSTNKTVNFLKKGHGWGKEINMSQYSKIIATTDIELGWTNLGRCDDGIGIGNSVIHGNGSIFKPHLPQPQQSFLKEFAANPNGEYKVEYVTTNRCCGRCDGVHDDCVTDIVCKPHHIMGCEQCFGVRGEVNKLKLNQDNIVTINSVEEKMYTLEQMYLSAANVVNQIAANRGNSNWNMKVTPKMIVDDWIKESL
tara:strand:- start:8554 stop:9363 length:810 start_codon:yes stop_codon:yes gene_type:complete